MKESGMSRRTFIQCSCITAGLTLTGLAGAGCDSVEADKADEEPRPGIDIQGNVISVDPTSTAGTALAAAGGFLSIPSAKVIAVNVDGQSVRAFTSVCTHQACDIDSFSNNRFVCPCHGSQFSTSGSVVRGPASAPLTEYPVTRSGNRWVITKA